MIQIHSVGSIYWGVEYEIPGYDTKIVSYAWLIEDMEPFRRSRWGCRIRFGSRGLHFGMCRRGEDPYRRGVAEVDEIREWRGSDGAEAAQSEGSADPNGEPVRSPQSGGPEPGVGGGLVELDPLGDELPSRN